jgi:thioredoxin reductase (NADPH)
MRRAIVKDFTSSPEPVAAQPVLAAALRPVILAIDDEPAVLNAVERDLRQKYGREYRIIKAASGLMGIDLLEQLRHRKEAPALYVVDQRMPEMSGVEFLERAQALFPEAKKVLLTAYADTEAAIQAINRVGLDYYLLKPWDPPDEHLYPIVDDLLAEWAAHAPVAVEGVRLLGALWSPNSHSVKDFLVRNRVPFRWLDVDVDAEARGLAEAAGGGTMRLPVLLLEQGEPLVDPDILELANRLGLKTRAEQETYDLVIVGSGPAGLAAAVYATSEGMRVLVIEKRAPGGQAGSSPRIENYLGFPSGISGGELARRAVAQARRFGAEILTAQEAVRIEVRGSLRVVHLADGSEVSGRALLLATGASFRTLSIPGADPLTGKGIYYGAAHTEAMSFRGCSVFVVGGANSAAQGALYLSRFASKVTVLVRGPEPVAAVYLQQAMRDNSRIEVRTHADLVAVTGRERLDGVEILDTASGRTEQLAGDALFVFIGVRPQSDLVKDLVLRDEKGYVLTGVDLARVAGGRPPGWNLDREPLLLESSCPGVFAAGDVRFGTNHRVASATGEGGVAVAMIRAYLKSP